MQNKVKYNLIKKTPEQKSKKLRFPHFGLSSQTFVQRSKAMLQQFQGFWGKGLLSSGKKTGENRYFFWVFLFLGKPQKTCGFTLFYLGKTRKTNGKTFFCVCVFFNRLS